MRTKGILFCLLALTLTLIFQQASLRAQADPGATVTTQHETIPNPVFGSNLRVTASCKNVATPCAWEQTSTWTTGAIPTANSHVIVDGNVRINSQAATALHVGVYPGGVLSFQPTTNTRLSTGDILVFAGGVLQIGTVDQPINEGATEIVIRDLPFVNDPKQHLGGVLVIDGTLQIHGRALSYTFLRTASELPKDSNTVVLTQSASAAGWRVGDQVVIPKSAQCPVATDGTCSDETEDRTLTAISADGRTLTLSAPLQFTHPGGRDDQGNITFLPHVLNKTRTVLFRSENPNGRRGHLLLHGRATIDMRYAALQHFGRTNIENLGDNNQKGRYPLHAHHLIGPQSAPANGYQFTLIGNVIDFGDENRQQHRKWGIAIHGSHYGLIELNIVDYASGAGIVTEDASETGNRFLRNFVVRVIGGNNEPREDRDPSDNTKLGRAGVGYWFNGGGGNYYEENVAAALGECVSCYGFKFDNVYNGDITIPSAQGSDPHVNGQTVDSHSIGITHFERNEVYAAPNGITIWWVCTNYETPIPTCSSLVKDLHVWHLHRWGYFAYETSQMTFDGFVMRGDVQILTNQFEDVTALFLVDYLQHKTVIRNADIQGVAIGMEAPVHRDARGVSGPDVGFTLIEDSYLSAGLGILVTAPSTTNGSDDLAPQTTLIRNVRFAHPSTRQEGHVAITDRGAAGATSKNLLLRNDVWIVNYNSAPGVDGADLYVVPNYQAVGRCDSALGNCANLLSATYPSISGGRVYPLLATPVVTPTPVTPTPITPTATVSATVSTPPTFPTTPTPTTPTPTTPTPTTPTPTTPTPTTPTPTTPITPTPAHLLFLPVVERSTVLHE